MRSFDLKTLPTDQIYQLMTGSIAPRPIAWASTIDEDGVPNLAPYSYFNAMSSDPPVVVFSSALHTKDGRKKDTLRNIEANKEVVINMVNYETLRQMALTSIEFPKNVSEFEQAGLTLLPSDTIKPFRVKESPVQLECKVENIIPLGTKGGAGHIIICSIQKMHIQADALDEKGRIDPNKLDLMGRLGRTYYVRANGNALHSVFQDQSKANIIGYDNLPQNIKNSPVLTANHIAQLAGLYEKPNQASILELKSKDIRIQKALFSPNPTQTLHFFIKEELDKNNIELAAQIAFLTEHL